MRCVNLQGTSEMSRQVFVGIIFIKVFIKN